MVPQASAVVPGAADAEPLAMPANHLDMVKFSSSEDMGYKKVSGHLQIMAGEASDAVFARWKRQDRFQEGTKLMPET